MQLNLVHSDGLVDSPIDIIIVGECQKHRRQRRWGCWDAYPAIWWTVDKV